MANIFAEKYKYVTFSSSGSTTAQYTPYIDMLGVKRAEFIVSMEEQTLGTGAVGGTAVQIMTCQVYQASNATGGGATAMATAKSTGGKAATAAISTAAKMQAGWLRWSTMDKATAVSITINSAVYVGASASTAANAYPHAGASDNASVASEAFAAMFNSSTNNTATAVTANFYCSTGQSSDGVPTVWILPKNPLSTVHLTMDSSAGSVITVGGRFVQHIEVPQNKMKDGCRYLSLAVNSSQNACAYTVVTIAEMEQGVLEQPHKTKSLEYSSSR